MDLADVMQKCAGEKEVAVDRVRIIAARQVTQLEQRDYVVKQSADESVVKRLGSRGILIRVFDFRIVDESAHQRLQMGIAEAIHKILHSLPQLANVLSGARQIVRIIDF